jgi:hypothetical protein
LINEKDSVSVLLPSDDRPVAVSHEKADSNNGLLPSIDSRSSVSVHVISTYLEILVAVQNPDPDSIYNKWQQMSNCAWNSPNLISRNRIANMGRFALAEDSQHSKFNLFPTVPQLAEL